MDETVHLVTNLKANFFYKKKKKKRKRKGSALINELLETSIPNQQHKKAIKLILSMVYGVQDSKSKLDFKFKERAWRYIQKKKVSLPFQKSATIVSSTSPK